MDDHIGATIAKTRRPYERDLLRAASCVASSRGGLVVDIGANIGNHAVYFALSGASVAAFEPNPAAVAFLQKNLEVNALCESVTLYPVAVGSRHGRGVLHPGDDLGLVRVEELEEGDVEIRTLDSMVTSAVSLIKIDVEGSEAEVLRGAIGVLQRDRPVVVAESHNAEARAEILRILWPLGYRRIPVSFAYTPTFFYVARLADGVRILRSAAFPVALLKAIGRGLRRRLARA